MAASIARTRAGEMPIADSGYWHYPLGVHNQPANKDGEVSWESMHADERLALAGLVRALVRADGRVSPTEAEALGGYGRRFGRGWWETMGQIGTVTSDPEGLAGLVIRKPVRDFVYALLEELAVSDHVADGEREILAMLRRVWSLTDLHDPF